MSLFQALILGIVQGLGEFIPISSSGHLVLVPWAFRWSDPGLSFDVALHLGTLFAVLAYFWRDWLNVLGALLRAVPRKNLADPQARLGGLLIIGTVPGIIGGVLLETTAETVFRDPKLVAVMLMSVGLILLLAEWISKRYKEMDQLSVWDVVLIGLAQAAAIVPGVSRSGATISMALFLGVKRASAARFSFMLGTPIIAGAAVKQFYNVAQEGIPDGEQLAFLVGILAAAVVGFAAIAFLLRFLQRNSTVVFVVYRLILGVAVLALAFARGS